MRIPILTYQPMYIHGNTYETNHLVALRADLERVTDAGFRIRPLAALVDAWRDGRADELAENVVAITCDDSGDFATRELTHPVAGAQPSVIGILRDFARERPGAQPELHVTSFEIVSPQARAVLDRTCLAGRDWYGEGAWTEALASGLMHVANHSWDHNHDTLPDELAVARERGTFIAIDDERLADHEVRQAVEYQRSRAPNPGCSLFAYPYGAAHDFVVHQYMPRHGEDLGLRAAFSGRAGVWRANASPWNVPRFICTRDWTSPDGLQAILDAARSAETWGNARARELARDKAALRSFAAFLRERVEAIPGWLEHEAALFTGFLHGVQRELGLAGDVLEIGVYRGKYLSVLYALSERDEKLFGVDLFVGDDKAEAARQARAHVEEACGDASRFELMVGDSMELDAAKLAGRCGRDRFRFISIDAGHTCELVLRDLRTATPLMQEGAIMALDDAFNYGTPGVIEGIARFFLRDEPALAPFAYCYNKLFVTTPRHHARYLAAAKRFLDHADWLSTCARTTQRARENAQSCFTPALFGHEVVAFV
jgi:predicted O-methyltransferase YrrM